MIRSQLQLVIQYVIYENQYLYVLKKKETTCTETKQKGDEIKHLSL